MSLGHPEMQEIEDPSDRSWRRSKRRRITVEAKPAPTVQAWPFVADHRVHITNPPMNLDLALTTQGTDVLVARNMWDPGQPFTAYYALSDSLAQWYATLM